jgi:hypothetical protein
MEKLNRRRLPMLHWLTAHDQKPDFLNQLAASIFFSLHDWLKHDCICKTHNIPETEEWSYLPSDSLIVMQCRLIAFNAIEHTQKGVATGWIEPSIGTWCGEKYQFVLPTIRAKQIKDHRSTEFLVSEEDALVIKKLLDEVKSKQSDTWDFVIKDYEKNPNKKISCMNHETRVLFPVMYVGQKYDIITKAGNKYIATVDASREFMSEGLEWKTTGNGNIEQYNIAAWRLIE